MSASLMTDFVRDLFQRSGDYRNLTQRYVRQEYMRHIGVTSLDSESKSFLKEIVEVLVMEMMKEQEEESEIEVQSPLKLQRTRKRLSANDAANAILSSDFVDDCDGGEDACGWPSCDDDSQNESDANVEMGIPSKKLKTSAFDRRSRKPTKLATESLQRRQQSQLKAGSTRSSTSPTTTGREIGLSSHKLSDSSKALKSYLKIRNEFERQNRTEKSKKNLAKKKTGNGEGHNEHLIQKEKGDSDVEVKRLEKIARVLGVLPVGRNYSKAFQECHNDVDRIGKLRKMLEDAGMTGPITLKNAEALKMRREAEELTKDLNEKNITITEGRGHRNVFSIYSRHAYKPKPPKTQEVPIKQNLSNLKDIVDSEESSSE